MLIHENNIKKRPMNKNDMSCVIEVTLLDVNTILVIYRREFLISFFFSDIMNVRYIKFVM